MFQPVYAGKVSTHLNSPIEHTQGGFLKKAKKQDNEIHYSNNLGIETLSLVNEVVDFFCTTRLHDTVKQRSCRRASKKESLCLEGPAQKTVKKNRIF